MEVGTKIFHPVMGVGEIIEVLDKEYVIVMFDNKKFGCRKLEKRIITKKS